MSELHKNLSALGGTALILNIVIGAGLLALPGLVVNEVGNHGLWAWLFCAITAFPLILISTVMGSRFPHAGGVAYFAGRAFGKKGYLMVSLLFLGAAIFGLPSITLTGGYYLAEILPVQPAHGAISILILCTLINLISPKMVSNISSMVAAAIMVSLVGLVVMGGMVIDWQAAPANIPLGDEINRKMILAPYMMIFFAFTGWEVTTALSEEFRNPKRDFPRAMIYSFLIATLLYLAMAFTVQNITISASPEAAFVSVAELAFGIYGKVAIAILAFVIILANIVGALWVVSRLIYSLSREGYLPLKLVVSSNGSPISSVLITACLLMLVLIINLFDILKIDEMLAIAGKNFLIIFAVISLALLWLVREWHIRALAIFALMIITGILWFSDQSIIYPACLMLLGVTIAWIIPDQKRS